MCCKSFVLNGWIFVLLLLISCRGEDVVILSEHVPLPFTARPLGQFSDEEPIGMYLLNEGNMGANRAGIDYIDFVKAEYIRSVYPERNPHVIKELGDVGNDIQIYGNRLYAVINRSNKVEVMDAVSCIRIGKVDIPNCRYIRFKGGKAYVSSYIGGDADPSGQQRGSIYEVDTSSLLVTKKVTIGFQPEELEIVGKYIYCVNSGGYRAPYYDSTISVIEIESFKQIQKIAVAVNPHRIRKDNHERLWVTFRGNYNNLQSGLCVVEHKNSTHKKIAVTDTFALACSDIAINGDSLYYLGSVWDAGSKRNEVSYGIVNVATKQIASEQFITDGTEREITTPYGIIVNPFNGDIYIADATNYVSSGVLFCYGADGRQKWKVRTQDIPAHMVFVYKNNLQIYGKE